MSAQNCFERTKVASFLFEFKVTIPNEPYPATEVKINFSGSVNDNITNRELACSNLLSAAVARSKTNRESVLLLNSTIPNRILPPPYPYPRVNFGKGYSYPEYVEFGADQSAVIVRYLIDPTSEELPWPTVLPALVVSTGNLKPSAQVKIIDPSAYTDETIYARLEVIDDVKKITNFIPTNFGAGAILYPNAPNDPAPSDTTIPRLFSSKEAFNQTKNISSNGKNERPCSGCGLCSLDPNAAFIPDELWTYFFKDDAQTYSGPGAFGDFPYYMEYFVNGNYANPLDIVVAGLNTNQKSPACKETNNNVYGIIFLDAPPSYRYYSRTEPLEIGENIFLASNYQGPPATVTIGLTYA